MANLNKVMLIGRITRDIELRYTPKGTAAADLGLAINRTLPAEQEGGERREETTFVDVTLWGKTAELAQQYLGKGRSVFIEGRLQLDTWDDKQTGQKRSKLKVVGEHIEFLGGRPAQGQGEAPTESRPAAQRPAPAPRPQPARDPDLDAEPDDIPF
jgi:single-strand DNA-binding protein